MGIERIPSPLPFPFSRAVRAGDFVFLSGQVPLDEQGKFLQGADIGTQTTNVLTHIEHSLALAGARIDQVVRATVWLSDMALFADFNQAWLKVFNAEAGNLPVRSTVGAQLAGNVDVEIEVQAYAPLSPR